MNIPKYKGEFAKELRRRNYSEASITNYASCVALFLSKMTKEHPLHVNEDDIKTYLGTFTEPNSQRSSHSAIKKFYDICFGQKNKFKFIPYCKKSKKLPIVLSPDEIQKMFTACENLKHRAIFSLMYACGLRVSEVVNMKIVDVDSSRMIINIIQGKGKKDRQVMLPAQLITILREYFKQYRPKAYLFNGQSSLQYSSRSINEFLKAIAIKAGVDNKRIHAHLVRHCTFTHMLENGVGLSIIQKVAGHSDIRTTQGYTHISSNLIRTTFSPLQNICV